MKTLASFLLVLVLVLGSGCSVISGSRVDPYGATLRISSYRLLWASENVKSTVSDTNGLSFTLSVDKSAGDAAAMQAIAAGVAQGLKP